MSGSIDGMHAQQGIDVNSYPSDLQSMRLIYSMNECKCLAMRLIIGDAKQQQCNQANCL